MKEKLKSKFSTKFKELKWNSSTLAFDAMWMTILALNNTPEPLRLKNISSLVTNDTKTRKKITAELRSALREVNFPGLSVS